KPRKQFERESEHRFYGGQAFGPPPPAGPHFDAAGEGRGGLPLQGLTRTIKYTLTHPGFSFGVVLPLSPHPPERQQQFRTKDRVPFAGAWRGLSNQRSHATATL